MYWKSLSFFQEAIKQIPIYRYEKSHRYFNQSPPWLEQPRDGGAICQGRRSRWASSGTHLIARQGNQVLHRLPVVPKDGCLRHQGRCAGHHGERTQRRCGLLGHAHLLLRDERSDEDPHRPHERDVPQGLQVPRRLSADHRGRERGVRAEARRGRPHRLDRLLRQVKS